MKCLQSESKISQLEEEIDRLKQDLTYFESTVNPTGSELQGQRQRPDRQVSFDEGNDIEEGLVHRSNMNYYDHDNDSDDDNKGEVAVSPILIQVWDYLR